MKCKIFIDPAIAQKSDPNLELQNSTYDIITCKTMIFPFRYLSDLYAARQTNPKQSIKDNRIAMVNITVNNNNDNQTIGLKVFKNQ